MRVYRVIFVDSGGERLPAFPPVPRRRAAAMCPKCQGTWPVWEPKEPPRPALTARIVETGRMEEPIGDEILRVNHAATATATTQRLQVSQRRLRTYEIHSERAHTGNTGIELVKLRIAAEIAVKQQYSISDGTAQPYAEEIEFTIPGHTVTEVTLHWKRRWQEGYAEVSDGAAPPVVVPFRLVIGITFDQESRDL